jgi:hypothetical protein
MLPISTASGKLPEPMVSEPADALDLPPLLLLLVGLLELPHAVRTSAVTATIAPSAYLFILICVPFRGCSVVMLT